MLDANPKLHKFNLTMPEGHGIIRMKRGEIMTENVKWNFIQEVQVGPFWFEEYLSEDETLVKKIWYDGYTEIFKCG